MTDDEEPRKSSVDKSISSLSKRYKSNYEMGRNHSIEDGNSLPRNSM